MSMAYFELLRQLERLDAPPRAEVRIEVGPINAATNQLELGDAVSVELRGSEVIIRGEETYKEPCKYCGITCKDDTEMINHLFDWHRHKMVRGAKEEPKQVTVDYLIGLLQAVQRDYRGDENVWMQSTRGDTGAPARCKVVGVKREGDEVTILGFDEL
jgi:hypothetical protein